MTDLSPYGAEALTDALASGDENAALELDRRGLFAAPGENSAQAAARMRRWLDANDVLRRIMKNSALAEIDDGIKVGREDLIPDTLFSEARERTRELYGFAVDWAVGFYLDSGVGKLWGGCAWHDESSGRTLFALRGSFRTRDRFWVYDRTELMAHELCHAARTPFGDDWPLEEFFAYRTSGRRLRRYLGNCFVRKFDALIFLGPALLVLLLQMLRVFLLPGLPWWPGWLVLAGCLGYLLMRNQLARRGFFRARSGLMKFFHASSSEADAFLFRSLWPEIKRMAAARNRDALRDVLTAPGTLDLRRRTALRRFIPEAAKEEHE